MSFLQSPRGGRLAAFAPVLALTGALTLWLWPIGVGGRMPVGGDVTQFSIGLMAVLGRALRAGRLPLWNDLWGFGFPGLAESQMGVYYPPHVLLYGVLPVEAAYTASLVLHTYWAGLGAFWAARRFGVSGWGAALSGFAWAASGMFLVHLPHPWGYTTGSWMPWALGLGWMLANGRGGARTALSLAAVLALQVLPGHFQFAFHTQSALALLAAWCVAARPEGMRRAIPSAGLILGAIAATLPLTAAQLWPTLQLARSADSQRTVEYLAAFPATPLHLVSYVAPDLFHRSPLWRPVAWDPFHAMPEEHRPYLGLVPLMLALGCIRRGVRRDAATQALAWIALVATLLSLGPYLPGFSLLTRLPGFSFFRAPARWGLLAELALAILAGCGFDAWRAWPHAGRMTLRFAAIAAVAVASVVAIVEGAFLSTEGPGASGWASVYESTQRLLPWSGDPGFRQVMASARRGPRDPLILTNLIARGVDPRAAAQMRLDRERRAVFREELSGFALRMALLIALALPLARRWRGAEALLLIFAAADLLMLAPQREIGTAPLRPLIEQSAVLGRLAKEPRGSRTIDGLRNLPMVAGAAPVAAYRTLDRPALAPLVAVAAGPLDRPEDRGRVREAMRAVGATVRGVDPLERSADVGEPVPDPALATWLYGMYGAKAGPFRLWRPDAEAPRAVFVPGALPETTDPTRILAILARGRPLAFSSDIPEAFEIRGAVDGPGSVVVSVLDDPEWRVSIRDARSEREVPPMRAFGTPGGGAWQAVPVEGGPFLLRWSYRGESARVGRWVSIAAWGGWLGAMAWASWRRKRAG